MAITGLSDLGDTIPTILGKATLTRMNTAVMRGLAWNYTASKGTTTNIPYFDAVTANALTEKVDMVASESLVDTNVQITPSEVGLKIILTDDVIEDDNENLKMIAGKVMGDAYEKKVDQDGLTQFASAASANVLGGSGTTLTMGHIAAGRGILTGWSGAGGPAPAPYACVIHPYTEVDIVDVITPIVPNTGTVGVQAANLYEQVLRDYSVGRLFGMPIIVDGNQAPDGSNNVKYGIFSSGEGGGMVYVEKRAPQIVPDIDPSLRGVELNYVGRYGWGIYHSGWIVELYNDASVPS